MSAKDLVNRDKMSKSDPFCVLFQRNRHTNEFLEVGRTEVINDNLNPMWDTKFTLDYIFQERQELKFAIYDWDGKTTVLSDHEYLGSVLCSLGEIVSAKGSKFARTLDLPKSFKGTSQIIINSEEFGTNKETFNMKINARGLDKKDLLGKSDPFLIISRQKNDGTWTEVATTEVVKKNLNPDWRIISGHTGSFTGGNPDRRLQFKVFDHDNDGKHDLIGGFETSFLELVELSKQNKATFPLINPKKKEKKKNYDNSGTLNIESLLVDRVVTNTFLDHVQTGTQLHFTVAIDFTASNGNPRDAKSLHYRHPDSDNQYSMAIRAVGSIIEDYDSDKMFPVLGFGAKVPPNMEVSHMFFVNGNPESPFCEGVSGILETYYQAIKTVRLYGPTYFAPIINHVASSAQTYKDGKNYFVLLVITDGAICDLNETKEAIINASGLPMSIIIVGVGDEDFSAMEFLDSDTRVLTHNGVSAVRDIVQFVDFKQFLNKHGENQQKAKEDLAEKVLAEIPRQFLQHIVQITHL